ncbi:MAG TPA: single-stranded-DNA-specific exonuclease RecJ [Dissulfurispiraceae bacterium]|nr:single-stranded-DNA-specific exonuclease RecJ [Dissulfurispiraceae bacterium]
MPAAPTYKWLLNRTNPEYVDYVARLASVSLPLAQVLINRGLKTSEQLDAFLNPSLAKLSDPYNLPDMEAAAARIQTARQRGERILVCGDYDADGVSATAILMEAFRALGMKADFFIPHRILHGYGFGAAGVERAQIIGAGLIVTVDCGISAFDTVALANSFGIDVIVTDHHEPVGTNDNAGFARPDAVAVVNPKLLDGDTHLKHLCGAGVAFKLAQALFDNRIDEVHHLLDLAAIGTSADVVPLVGDNRIFVREGIRLIQENARVGIRALKEAAGLKPDFFKPSFLPFVLIPRINAAGRVEDASVAVALLTTTSEDEAGEHARSLQELNAMRQEIEESVLKEAGAQLPEQADGQGPIFLAGDGWHPGVIGIVASRIADRYFRPVFVFSLAHGSAKGSARSIPSFNLYQALSECSSLLTRFGGHKQAAGLSLPVAQLPELRTRMTEIMNTVLSDDDFFRAIEIDASLNISDVTFRLVDEITRLEPFGYGNAEPVFGCRGLEATNPRIVGNNHLKMHLRQNGRGVDSIGFDLGGHFDMVDGGARIDAAFLPVLNEWEGGRSVQLNIRAIRLSS